MKAVQSSTIQAFVVTFATTILVLILIPCTRGATSQQLFQQADELIENKLIDSAILVGRIALVKAEREDGATSLSYSRALVKLADYYQFASDYHKAKITFERSLEIKELYLESNKIEVAQCLRKLGIVYVTLDDFGSAEDALHRSIEIITADLDTNMYELSNSLAELAIVYNNQNRMKLALITIQKAIDVSEILKVADFAVNLFHKSNFYLKLGETEKAIELLNRVLSIWKTRDEYKGSLAAAYSSMAMAYLQAGEFELAEQAVRNSYSNWKSVFGPANLHLGSINHTLAICLFKQGRLEEAEFACNESLRLLKGGLGDTHTWVAKSLELYAKIARMQQRNKYALKLAIDAYRIKLSDFRINTKTLSEYNALTYSEFLHTAINNFLSCYNDLQTHNSEVALTTADIVVSSKGLTFDGILQRQKSQVTETDSTTLALAEALRLTKFLASKLYVEGPGKDVKSYRSRLDSLSDLANEQESDLARHSASFSKQKDYENVNVDRIAKLLPEKTSLIEFLRYDYLQLNPDSTIPHYLAVVLDGSGEPAIVELGEASDIDKLIESYRKLIALDHFPLKTDLREYTEVAQELYKKVWLPFDEYISDANQVFVAPDGGLNLISFATLIDDEGKYLIEHFPIHYLSAGRDLIRLKDKPASGSDLLAMGDPDFNATIAQRQEKSQPVTIASSDVQSTYGPPRFRSACGEISELKVGSLSDTRDEIDQIVDHWTGEKVTTFFGPQANEDNFKTSAPGKRVIHLATHGYFLEGKCNQIDQSKHLDRDYSYVGENPLLLSGLLFAGSNLHGVGADSANIDDGVLSAYEVSALDLTGVDMVVLSACETGLGEVKEGEGVYGLRRAFQLAGARTVISSLWKVDSKTTASMMAELYTKSDETLPIKLRRVQLAQIKILRDKGLADHPFTWGAWVATGDWR